jgi:hypothetical protein
VILSAVGGLIGKLATRLRFPQLFAATAVIFLVDLLIPDLIPFADELLLGLLTVLLGMWRQKPAAPARAQMKDVTPGRPSAPG